VVEERAILVGVELNRPVAGVCTKPGTARQAEAEESLEELSALARGAGAVVIDRVLQTRSSLDAATLIGSGKVSELALQIEALQADLVVFDRNLAPTQQRNLEWALACKVLDRTQLILDIFARRARTREGQLQVELAQLNYLLPRLTGRGTALSRLGGGIGTRGPGETQLETDRRRIFRRIQKIAEQLEAVRATRSVQRRQRQSVPLATAALVGYTNAGKSTLFNKLTGADVLADSRMFATLDPTIRQVALPSNRRILLGDTVGFIRNLPTTLVEAFRATLEEVTEAALLLHVVDASSPSALQHTAHVSKVLSEIGAGAIPQLLVLNKVDLLRGDGISADAVCSRILAGFQPRGGEDAGGTSCSRVVAVSAHSGEGLPCVLEAIDALVPLDPISRAVFRFPLSEGAKLSLLHDFAQVVGKRYEDCYCVVEADVPASLRRRLQAYLLR